MELGALVCRPRNPDCGACPVRKGCGARKKSAQDLYPERLKSAPIVQKFKLRDLGTEGAWDRLADQEHQRRKDA